MFQGFQRTGASRITYSPSNLFFGFPSTSFASSPNPFIANEGIIAWWDSNGGVTLNGSTVSSWQDKISGLTLTQSTAANQPDYSAATIYRNYPEISNFSTTKLLSGGAILDLNRSQERTFVFVLRRTAAAFITSIPTRGDGSISLISGGNTISSSISLIYVDEGGVNKTFAYGAYNQTSAPQILHLTINRTTGLVNAWRNSVKNTALSITASNNNLTSVLPFQIGGNGSSNGFTYFEVIVYNRQLSDDEIRNNVANLAAKYGISNSV